MIKNRYFLIRIISTLLMATIFILLNVFFITSLLNSTKQILTNNITKIIYTEYDIQEDNSFIVVTNYYQLINKDNQEKTNIIMQQEYNDYNILVNFKLKKDEIIITNKLANKLNIKEGKYIKLVNPYNHQLNNYKCVGIIPDIQISDSIMDYNLIIMGFDDKYLEFKSNNEMLIIDTPERKHNESVLASNIVVMQSTVFKNFLIVIVILFIQLIIVYITLETINNYDKYSIKYIKKMFLYGTSMRNIRFQIIVKRLIIFTLLSVPTIILIILNRNFYMITLLIPIIFHEFYDVKINIDEYRLLR